jgi:starch-binding outer membrane protein, SusD/RagB family
MKNRLIKYFYLIMIGLFIICCKKDFLDVSPMGVINSGSFFATRADAENAVTTVYGMLDYMSCWDEGILADLGSIASDDAEAGGNNYDDVPDFQYIDKFTYTPTSGSGLISEAYGVLYKSIYYANIALENLPDIPKKDTSATPVFINQRIGEIKFLRALDYFYLVQVFGEVPLVDHVLGASEYDVSRSSLRSVFDLMEKDLNDAIATLPVIWPSVTVNEGAKTKSGNDVGRVTKGSAQALLAKVLMFESSYARNYPGDNYSLVNAGASRFKDLEQKWSEVLTNAENVINSGQYELVGIDGQNFGSWRDMGGPANTNGFRYIWTTNGDNSKEAVFEIENEYLARNWLFTRGSAIVWWTGARWIFNKKGNPSESKYWGFNVPNESLVAEYNQEQRQPGDPLYGSLTPADPRFNTTIHKDTIGGNDSIMVLDGATWSKICYQYTSTQFVGTKMYQAKYECSFAEYLAHNPNWSESPMNIRIIRYADIVLVAAEAALMTGDQATALKYINMVRTRARMSGPAGNTCPRDLQLSDLTNSQHPGFPAGFDQLIHERRLELAMEGHRFYDLVRWNLTSKYLNNMVLTSGYQVNFVSPKNDFYCLPQQEMNTSKNLVQYLGW